LEPTNVYIDGHICIDIDPEVPSHPAMWWVECQEGTDSSGGDGEFYVLTAGPMALPDVKAGYAATLGRDRNASMYEVDKITRVHISKLPTVGPVADQR
jgi:hypothetical protein